MCFLPFVVNFWTLQFARGFLRCESALCSVFEYACSQSELPTPRREPGVTASWSAGVRAAEYQFCFVVSVLQVLIVCDFLRETSGESRTRLVVLESERHKDLVEDGSPA